MTFEFMTDTVQKNPNKVAITEIGVDGKPDRSLTFKELEEYINQVANFFTTIGLKKGDCVVLFLENSADFLALYLSLEKIGVISALINHNLRGASLLHCLKIAESSGLIFSGSLSDAVNQVLSEIDPAIKSMCYSVGEKSSIPDVEYLASKLENVSKESPPLLEDRSTNGNVMCMC